MTFYSPSTDTNLRYISNAYAVSIEQPETISWSIPNQFWSSFKAYCPEMYSVCDANQFGVAEVQFNQGRPFFLNLSTTTTYNTFFGEETDFVITIVCNTSPVSEKRFLAIALDSKNKTSSITGAKFDVYNIQTSDNQLSDLPLESFVFRENFLYGAFMRATNLGGTKQTGAALRGTWVQCTLVRDETLRTEYSEFAKAIIFVLTSEYTTK